MSVITNLEPKLLWKHFDEIRKIPRCSKHEEKIRAYIVAFAKEQGLPYKEDKVGNIVIRKPATKGMENKPIIVLQGHMDMVCEKNSDVQHDFTKDPIKLKREGDLLTADGTSLGADNGIGVAISLAILEESTIKHGSLEGLFTIDEETGLTGAFALGKDMLKGRIMLNLDSEDFGVITVGCAGGGDSQIKLPLKQTSPEKALKGLQITIAGLRGGHSGVDAHEQRGNAIKILTRLLWKAANDSEIHLSSIKGGDKHNAIPREATAIIATPATKTNKVMDLIKEEGKDIAEEIKPIDPKLKIDIKHCDLPKKMMTKDAQDKALNLLHALPHGVDKMSYDIPNLVETSTNLATVVTEENKLVVGLSSRSSIMSALQDFRDRIHALSLIHI